MWCTIRMGGEGGNGIKLLFHLRLLRACARLLESSMVNYTQWIEKGLCFKI